ncbi:MAG TPA: hypothetical protein PK264_17690 [Hyphomicrobiaceae bacterium]|nr:hypothetical protein [Hyphomicrobiaceae bacterium]
MRRYLAALVVAVATFALVGSSPAEAKKLCFGTDEHLRFVQKLDAKGPNGEPLELARKIRMECFVAPYTVADDGYVLKIVGANRYFSLTPEIIAGMQKANQLPNPMPPYQLDTMDRIFGHLLWILIGVFALVSLVSWLRKRSRA